MSPCSEMERPFSNLPTYPVAVRPSLFIPYRLNILRTWLDYRALQLLGYRLPTLLMAGHHSLSPQWPLLQPFHKMPLQARQAVLQSWAHSSLPQLRKVRGTATDASMPAAALWLYRPACLSAFWLALQLPAAADRKSTAFCAAVHGDIQ